MNSFLLSPQQRLVYWKEFRTNLSKMPEIDQLSAVAEYWKLVPLKKMAYDPEALDLLPSPWEMISSDDWCKNSVAVGMEFTLRLSGWNANRMTIKMMRDYDISDQKLVLEIDENHLINYDYGIVTKMPATRFDIISSWRFIGRNYQRI